MAPGTAGMSAAQIEAMLTPEPSVSRTGKMAHSAMHTDALVRSGVAALQKKKLRKQGGGAVAEVVEPSSLDAFGTAPPGHDKARSRELCSSPRGHPDLQGKLRQLAEKERAGQFAAKMALTSPARSPGASPREAERAAAAVRPDAAPVPAPAAAAGDAGRRRKAPQQSACFRTKDRFAGSKHAHQNPPVGHYRPKYKMYIDARSPAALIRGKEAVSVSPRKFPPGELPDRSDTSPRVKHSYLPRDVRRRKEEAEQAAVRASLERERARREESAAETAATATAKDAPLSPGPGGSALGLAPHPPPMPGDAAGADKAPGRGGDYQAWVELVRGRDVTNARRGTPCFMSKVAIAADRPTPPTVSPDKWYYPYNEATVSGKRGKSLPCNLDFDVSRMTGRGDRIMFKGFADHSEAPSVTYDMPDHGPQARAAYSMTDQVSRAKAAADAQGMSSRREHTMNSAAADVAPLHKYPASHVVYDTSAAERLKFSKSDTSLSFDRVVSREQRPTEVQRPRVLHDPSVPYEARHTERTSGAKLPLISFSKQTDRPEFLARVPHDLEYDCSPGGRRAQTADLNRTVGHESLFVPSITQNCSYKPNYDAVKPKTSHGPSLRRMLSRDDVRGGVPQPTMLDHFYQTDCAMHIKVQGQDEAIPLRGSRTQGNPMLQRHMSRETRQRVTRLRKVSPERFYDYDISKVRPNPDRATVEFRRVVGREEKSCGRLQPCSPRAQAAESQRSPGFVYDPNLDAVKRHVPAAAFSSSPRRT